MPDYLALMTRGLQGLRVGLDREWVLERVDAPTRRVLEDALAVITEGGGQIVEIHFPDADQAVQDWVPLCAVETAVTHESTFPARRDEYGPGLAGLLDLGLSLSALDYQKLLLRRTDAEAPVAFQFVAPHFAEHLLVQAGWAFQRATDWHRRHPPL